VPERQSEVANLPCNKAQVCKKPDPGIQLGFKILLDRGHEVDITALYRNLRRPHAAGRARRRQ